MSPLKFASLLVLCASASVAALPAFAQQTQPKNQDAPPPPKLEKLEEGEPPAVNIREQKKKQTVTEQRAPGGEAKEVKVTKGKNTYYVKPKARPGCAMPGDCPGTESRATQWHVYEFNQQKKPKESEMQDAPPPAVAPEPAPEKK
jgi:hypothetical protein